MPSWSRRRGRDLAVGRQGHRAAAKELPRPAGLSLKPTSDGSGQGAGHSQPGEKQYGVASTELAVSQHAFSRRRVLGSGTALMAAASVTQAAAADPARLVSASDPGPENAVARSINQSGFTPPPSDHGTVPNFWQSFSLAHRSVQDGGWSRQVNVEDFPISTELAGVNMRLTAGGVRELHWHAADEWALMLNGNCRLTANDLEGCSYVQDVAEGDLWHFPTGIPHSLQGLGPDGCEFLLVFDDGKFSEDNTTLISD
jgi:oxalate decarboxylase